MKKRLYIVPQSEVMRLSTDVIMEAFGPASVPTDPFGGAPAIRGNVDPNAPVSF